MKLTLFCMTAMTAMAGFAIAEESPVKPMKALLVIGGCCHDYAVQKDIIKTGLEARLPLVVDICYSPDKNTVPDFECYKKDDWANGYDVIIHDECAAGIKDAPVVNRVLAPHAKGLPAVNLHCAMHSFRVASNIQQLQEMGSDGGAWFEFLGIQSSGHGPKKPIEINYVKDSSPIVKGLADWTSGNEELYNNIHVYDGVTAIAQGKQEVKPGNVQEAVIAWTHEYGEGKAKVFSTTLGHFNEIVADDRYLDLVARGLLWATGKLGADGNPATGYWIEGE